MYRTTFLILLFYTVYVYSAARPPISAAKEVVVPIFVDNQVVMVQAVYEDSPDYYEDDNKSDCPEGLKLDILGVCREVW